MPSHEPLQEFAAWSGPRDARLVIVGEAWGESEARAKRPFVGSSGQELWRMLGEAIPDWPGPHRATAQAMRYGDLWVTEREGWLGHAQVAMTNVFALRPPGNAIGALCGDKAQGQGLPPLGRTDKANFPNGPFLRPEFVPELDRLRAELAECQPNVIVAMGNTALWAMLQATNIGSVRGNVALASRVTGTEPFGAAVKVQPTYHPAGVLRQWSWRPIVVADLMKAWRESSGPELIRPKRWVLVNPGLDEMARWVRNVLVASPPTAALAVDIETGQGQIKCIGFARSCSDALVVPFVDLAAPDGSYWPRGQERAAWELVARLLASPVPKVFQNGLYDLQYIWRMGFQVANCLHDTMLLHHSLFPELQKGLGFLGSIYTSEASWKLMRRPKADTEKRDE